MYSYFTLCIEMNGDRMKYFFILMAASFTFSAQAETPAEHRKETIEQHKAIANAHLAAAQCLASGKDEEACHAELAIACKGIALGKLCGMRHEH
jgi:hypothetical protein